MEGRGWEPGCRHWSGRVYPHEEGRLSDPRGGGLTASHQQGRVCSSLYIQTDAHKTFVDVGSYKQMCFLAPSAESK